MDKSPLTSFLRCYGGDGLEREGGGEEGGKGGFQIVQNAMKKGKQDKWAEKD